MNHWRPAIDQEAWALCDLERRANLVGLAHVFPADQYPFPEQQVLARWALVLADPGTRVEVMDDVAAGRLIAVTAYDHEVLRHLAVHPGAWGRGLGRSGVERAVQGIQAGGEQPRLWCLVENQRARALYERLGWVASGERKSAEWPPHPQEMEYVLAAVPTREGTRGGTFD